MDKPDKPDKLDMDLIIGHVANGGSLIDLCESIEVRYSDAMLWVIKDPVRNELYKSAIRAREEWFVQNVLLELSRVINVDIRKAFNADGTMKQVTEMPVEIAKAVASVEVEEIWSGGSKNRIKVGETKKIKFWNKMPALEMLGKNLKMFIDRVEHGGLVSLEQLVARSNDQKPMEVIAHGNGNGSDTESG